MTSELPTRRSLREQRHPSGRRTAVRIRLADIHAARVRIARTVALIVVPALLGTIALPAFASESGSAEANALILTPADTQSYTVASDAASTGVARDGYSATTAEELAAERTRSQKTRVGALNTGMLPPYNYGDGDLVSFLAGIPEVWQRPVAARPTSDYGPRAIVCNRAGCSNSFHDGVDLGTSCGTPIAAISAGRVSFVGSAGSYGNRVVIDHGGGVQSVYGHVASDSYQVKVGDLIPSGTVVAEVGATGVVTACVLDLKVTTDGDFTDPVPFLAQRGITL